MLALPPENETPSPFSSKYQVLPALASEDYSRLEASIRERGVQVAVIVDEAGEILDGHHRAAIARSLGIDYPTVTQSGLSEAEKRILAAEINVARRHMTDAQKVLLGRQIEPDIAARAAERERAGKSLDPMDNCPQGTTRDEVARIVGLGSGRTYERGKQVIEAVERVAPDLVKPLHDGDWKLRDATSELRQRGFRQQREQAKAEQEQSDHLISIVGDPHGNIARAKLKASFSKQCHTTHRDLLNLKPSGVVAVLDSGDRDMAQSFIHDCRSWLDALEAELGKGWHVVTKE